MRILAFTTCYWDTEEEASRFAPELKAWANRVKTHLKPDKLCLAMKSCNFPHLNPVPEAQIVSAHVPMTRIYDPIRWSYYMCAVCAMLWNALWRDDWDLLVGLENSTYVNTANLPVMLEEFSKRPELIAAPSWGDWMEVDFMAWKREAIPIFLNGRLRPNLWLGNDYPILIEEEITQIFKGHWWNPWPGTTKIRQEYANKWAGKLVADDIARHWPLIDCPTPELIKQLKLI